MAHKYTAELTITQAVADRSHGGVIYYFCHIHSKMSGKIVISTVDGSRFEPTLNPTELELYSPVVRSAIDATCGTTGVAQYTYGQSMACSGSFLCGDLDTNPRFGQCLQGVDCAMNAGMFGESTPDHHAPLVTFMEQMIPHHLNAINMAKLLLKSDCAAVRATDGLEDILWQIINVQNFQVHQFRDGGFELRLVSQGDMPAEFHRRIHDGWVGNAAGGDVPLRIVEVGQIDRSRGGKFQEFTSDFVPHPDSDAAPE